MAVVIEKVGQELEGLRGRQVFQVHDVATASIAWGLVDAIAPVIWSGLIKQDISVRELGNGIWEGEAPYGTLERPEPGSIDWSFDIGTSNLRITQALDHVESYDYYGLPPPDHKGAIGVRQDGNGQSVEGCDVVIPIFTWEETHYFDYAVVATHSWIETHEGLVATVNEDPFRIWAKGELLLLGVSGRKQGEKPIPVTYKFASSRTKTSFPVGEITVDEKEGHHYLWIEYWPHDDDSSKSLTARPYAAHVEKVYEYADWQADLPLPDPWS